MTRTKTNKNDNERKKCFWGEQIKKKLCKNFVEGIIMLYLLCWALVYYRLCLIIIPHSNNNNAAKPKVFCFKLVLSDLIFYFFDLFDQRACKFLRVLNFDAILNDSTNLMPKVCSSEFSQKPSFWQKKPHA